MRILSFKNGKVSVFFGDRFFFEGMREHILHKFRTFNLQSGEPTDYPVISDYRLIVDMIEFAKELDTLTSLLNMED